METLMESLKDERVLLAVTAAVVGVSLKMMSDKRRKLPPGPPVWPIVGSLPSIRNDIQVFSDLAAKYGDIYFMQFGLFGQVPTVVLNNMDLFREALLQKQDDFAGRMHFPVFEIIGANGHDMVFGDFKPEWRYQRKIAHVALRKYATGTHFQELLERNVEMISEIFRKGGDQPQDVYQANSLLIYNIIASFCFGKRYDMKDPEFNFIRQNVDRVNDLFDGFFVANLLPVLKHLPTPAMNTLKRIAKDMHAFIDNQLAEHRRNFDESDLRDLTDYIILSEKEMKSTGLEEYQVELNDIHFRQTIFDMFFGGTDTTCHTLTWALLFMASNPDIQKKAQKEIDENMGEEVKINALNRTKIPLCEAIIYETLRLRPPAPLGLPHCAIQDSTLGGYDIPEGTQVIFNIKHIQVDAEEWVDAEVYNPGRFLDKDGNLAPKPNAFIPFSAGRRSCVGESLAKSELHILLGSLLQRFTFSLPGGKPIDLTPKPNLLFTLPNESNLVVNER